MRRLTDPEQQRRELAPAAIDAVGEGRKISVRFDF